MIMFNYFGTFENLHFKFKTRSKVLQIAFELLVERSLNQPKPLTGDAFSLSAFIRWVVGLLCGSSWSQAGSVHLILELQKLR